MEQFYEKIYELCMNIQIFKYYGSFQIISKNILCKQWRYSFNKRKIIDVVTNRAKNKKYKTIKTGIDDYLKGKYSTIKIVMLEENSKGLEYILSKYKISFSELGSRY